MSTRRKIGVGISLLVVPFLNHIFFQTAYADMFTPTNPCSKPWDKSDSYAIDSYKNCIESFVDKMSREANTHRNAANNAIQDWNSFARGF